MTQSILVVDDDADARDTLGRVLRREGYQVSMASTAMRALQAFGKDPVDLVITDIRMPDMDGIELLRELKARRPDVPVILMTAFASVDTAVQAVDQNAYDYVRKPYHLAELRASVRRALEHRKLLQENRELRSALGDTTTRKMVGTSPAMFEVYKAIARVAKSDATVLILGESGTGKEMAAREIHENSRRTSAPFIAINCGGLVETLLESELFGHEKGAFTGANATRKGLFEAANKGTLLLDEISETSPQMQTKLLRVLEEHEITRVGSTEVIPVDVRVIAASNRSLAALVRDGRFREDLYYRLHVVEITLPPLRERAADLPLLFDYFLARHAQKLRKTVAVAPGLIEILQRYRWPGNVRELENVVERAVTMNHTSILDVEDLPPEILAEEKPEPSGALLSLDDVQARHIRHVINAVGGNISRAAETLGVDRRRLYRMIDRYKLWNERMEDEDASRR